MTTEAWVVLAVLVGGAWWWWISQKPQSQVDRQVGEIVEKPAFAWLVIVAGGAIAIVVGIQVFQSLSNPGRCLSGPGGDGGGAYCDEWESGDDSGWWFLK